MGRWLVVVVVQGDLSLMLFSAVTRSTSEYTHERFSELDLKLLAFAIWSSVVTSRETNQD